MLARSNRIVAVAALSLLSACSVSAVRKNPPTPFIVPAVDTRVTFQPAPSATHEVDLGSLLFRRTLRTPGPVTLAAQPVGTDKGFPGIDGWIDSWTYTGADAPGAAILTHPLFYRGAIGVIVNDEGELQTRAPVIQVEGNKKGRRWYVTGGPAFLKVSYRVDSWALRYGGERDGGHRFMIVDYADDKEREVVQDFRVSFEDAKSGFSVKGVRVKVHSFGAGRIRYSFEPNSET
jgi:hypothetical protein